MFLLHIVGALSLIHHFVYSIGKLVGLLFMIANVILIPFLKKYSAVFYFILCRGG